MIKLTSRAANKFKKSLSERGRGLGIRVAVKGTGCSGYSYIVNFADSTQQDDLIFDELGVRIFVDPDSYKLIKDTEIDFEQKGLTEALRFRNPQVKGECGCGESFSI